MGNGATCIVRLIGTVIWSIHALREKRDMEAAKRFFTQAVEMMGHAPERATADGHDSSPRALRETIGNQVVHRTNAYLNNRIEQDHRGIRTALLPHARVWKFHLGITLLSGI